MWEHEREQFATAVLGEGGEAFEAARSAARRLSLDEAVEYALGDDA
jgi:hypothetical protein